MTLSGRTRARVILGFTALILGMLLIIPTSQAALTQIATLQLPSNGLNNEISSLVSVGGFLYAGILGVTNPPRVAQVDTSSFTHVATKACLAAGAVGPALSVTAADAFVYAGLGSPDAICRFSTGGLFADTAVMRTLSTSGFSSFGGKVTALAVSGDFLYAGLQLSNAPALGMIVRVRISTFPLAGAGECSQTFQNAKVTALAVISGFVYGALDNPTGASSVVRIDPGTCGITGPLQFAADETKVSSLAQSGGWLFAGLSTQPGKVVKIELSGFTKVGTLTLSPGEDRVLALAGGSVLIAGLGTSPGCVVKIDPTSFVKQGTLCFAGPSEDQVTSLESIGGGFAGLDTTPGKIVKVQDTVAGSTASTTTVTVTTATTPQITTLTSTLLTTTSSILVTFTKSTVAVAIPGFPAESIISGLILGILGLIVLKRMKRSDGKD